MAYALVQNRTQFSGVCHTPLRCKDDFFDFDGMPLRVDQKQKTSKVLGKGVWHLSAVCGYALVQNRNQFSGVCNTPLRCKDDFLDLDGMPLQIDQK
jgi:hypothetical protein